MSGSTIVDPGSLAAIAGPLIDLTPPLNVQPGTVLLTLRHGKPVSVVRPGRKLRRGRGLPVTMSPQGIAISTESIPLGVRVADVALKGPYWLTSVEAQLRIRVDDAGDYAGLRAYVTRKGVNFAALLDAEIRSQLEGRIRSGLAPRTAAEIYELATITGLVDLTAPLLDGLFRIETVVHATPVYHEEFLRAREAVARSATDAAEKVLELREQLPLEAELSRARDQQLLEEADRRGISMVEHENPALIEQGRAQDADIKKTLIEQLDALRRGGGSETVRQVLDYLGDGGRPPAPPSLPAETPAIDGDGETIEHDITASSPGVPRLRTDPTLAHLWRTAGLPGEPIGIALDASPSEVTVLAVCEADVDATLERDVHKAFAERVGATTVIAVGGVRCLRDLVEGYLVARLPGLAEAAPTIDVIEDDAALMVRLGSDTHRMSGFMGRINDPETRLLDPLAGVLPYATVKVVTSGSRQ